MKIQIWTPRVYGALLTAHAAVLIARPAHVLSWSYGCVLLVLATTLLLCLRRMRLSVQHNRPLWAILLAALAAQTIAFSLLFSDSLNHVDGILVGLDPTLYFCVSSLLLTLASSFNPVAPLYRWASTVDVILACGIGVLFYTILHGFLAGPTTDATTTSILWMFDALGLFVAVFATLRFTSTTRADERRFFFILAAFAWIDFVLPAIHNRFVLSSESYLPELLLSVPFALVGLLLSRRNTVWLRGYRPTRTLRYISASLSPFVLSLALCGLAFAQIESSPKLATGVLILAVASYAVRTAIVLAHHLAFEEELKRLKRGLQQTVIRDELTGLLNRRGFYQLLHRGWDEFCHSKKPLTVAMVDIDRFKAFNDTYGHLAGDDCLAVVASVLARVVRQHANVEVARYGGEEFVVLLRDHQPAQAEAVLEQLRLRVESMQIQCARNSADVVTVSAGLASTTQAFFSDSEKLLSAADAALYEAKHAGRNRLHWAVMETYESQAQTNESAVGAFRAQAAP